MTLNVYIGILLRIIRDNFLCSYGGNILSAFDIIVRICNDLSLNSNLTHTLQ